MAINTQEVDDLAREIQNAGSIENIKKLNVTPTGLLGLGVSLFFMCLDLLYFDTTTILTLVITENFYFAFFITFICTASFSSELCTGNLQRLPHEVRETTRTGIPTDALLMLMERETGFEAFGSLMLTSYAFPFSFTTPYTFCNGCFSLASSAWGMGSFLHERLDLEPE